jgi:hypothetical protein
MATVKTATGFEAEIDESFREDWEFFEALESTASGRVTGQVQLAHCLLSDADLKRLKDHCREDNGRVSAEKMTEELFDIIKNTPSGKNS